MSDWKAGMAVALFSAGRGLPRKTTIARVTPSGIAAIVSTVLGIERFFNKNGIERGAAHSYWGRPHIAPWGAEHEEMIAEARKEKLYNTMQDAMRDLDAYAIDEIRAVAETIRAERIASKNANSKSIAAA